MNKKVLLFSLLLSGCFYSVSAQEGSSSRTLIIDEVDYGKQNETYNAYKTTWQKNPFKDNWFITIGGGAQTIFGEDDTKQDFTKRITFAPQISVGKYFSPIWGLRLNFTGGSLHGFNDGDSGTYRKWNNGSDNYMGEGYAGTPGYPGGSPNTAFLTWDPTWNYMYSPEEIWKNVSPTPDGKGYQWTPEGMDSRDHKGTPLDANGDRMLYMQHVKYVQMNIDFMFDLLTLFGDYNPKRFFDITPYAGAGVYHAFPNRGTIAYTTAGVHAGLITKFRLSDRIKLNAEFAASMVGDEFDGQGGDNHAFTGIGQATLGLQFNLGKTYWQVCEPMDHKLINDLNNQINILRQRPEFCEDCPECPAIEIAPTPPAQIKFLPDPVFFRIDKSVIDPAEWAKVEKAVDFLNKNPEANVVVTGYADKKTAYPEYNMKLSERRSKTVAQALTQKYGINPLRVSINWSGDEIQPFKVNEWNRVVIFVIED